jgi:hypothetical protein
VPSYILSEQYMLEGLLVACFRALDYRCRFACALAVECPHVKILVLARFGALALMLAQLADLALVAGLLGFVPSVASLLL